MLTLAAPPFSMAGAAVAPIIAIGLLVIATVIIVDWRIQKRRRK